jgi:ABC-2 type transport system ATP-binding protein
MVIAAIKTENLRKTFGDRTAVQGLTMQVGQGEVFGFLGPNGAGKTTSLKMLLGLVLPTSGAAWLLDKPAGDRATRSQIGFLPEHFRFQEWLTASEFLEFHGLLLGMNRRDLNARKEKLLERVGLSEFSMKQLHTFSKGMLQRVGLAQALLNRPSLVFLDEPTSGLDPVGRRLVRDIIYELRREGTCVFLNSHLLSEIEVTCDRVVFIKQGEVLRVLNLTALENAPSLLMMETAGLTTDIISGLDRWGREIHMEGGQLTMTIQHRNDIAEANRYLVERGVSVFSLTPTHPSLEEIFVETVGIDGGL